MGHLSDDGLRAFRETRRVSRRDYAHVDRCLRCRRALGVPLQPMRARPWRRIAILVAVAAVLAFASIAPLRGLAYGFVEIFEPQTIAFVPMSSSELRDLSEIPNLDDIGSASTIVRGSHGDASNVRAAQALAGFRLRLPQAVIGSVQPQFSVEGASIQQLVFDDGKARESARREGKPWQPMPQGMDGSAVRLVLGPVVLAAYRPGAPLGRPAPVSYTVTFRRGGTAQRRPEAPLVRSLDDVVVMQMPTPKLGATGASLETIERYVFDRPGVPPRLAAAFAALRNPATTLALPIPQGAAAFEEPVRVDGVWGTRFGDETGLGSAVMWARGGIVYAVAGTRSVSEILAIADSLE